MLADPNKVGPLGHTLKKVILLISSGMESLEKRAEPSRHLPETGLSSRGAKGSQGPRMLEASEANTAEGL